MALNNIGGTPEWRIRNGENHVNFFGDNLTSIIKHGEAPIGESPVPFLPYWGPTDQIISPIT